MQINSSTFSGNFSLVFTTKFKQIILFEKKRFLKERKQDLVHTEYHFLFICKLVGPFLSKIHIENTNLLIEVEN